MVSLENGHMGSIQDLEDDMRQSSGFTLLELLTVIVAIGILVAVILISRH